MTGKAGGEFFVKHVSICNPQIAYGADVISRIQYDDMQSEDWQKLQKKKCFFS